MTQQFGFDFSANEPARAPLTLAAWHEPELPKADWIAKLAQAEKYVQRITGVARPLFDRNIEAARAYIEALEDGEDACAFRGHGIEATDAQRASFIGHCMSFAGSNFEGIEYKYRDELWIKIASMHVEGVGTLIAREWTTDNGNLDFVPWRDTFFNVSYRDKAKRVFAPVALWGGLCSAQKIAMSKGIPSVQSFRLNGRDYIHTSNISHGGIREATAWSVCPASDWKGATYNYESIRRAWDAGTVQRGDEQGMLVQVRGQLCVLDSPLKVYDDSSTAMDVAAFCADEDVTEDEPAEIDEEEQEDAPMAI
jgi:hypothetical protein